MTIYEIDQQIAELLNGSVDEETGELVFNDEALEALAMQKEQKIENCALAFKNYEAEAKAIKEEAKLLTERAKRAEKQAENAKKFLEYVLAGEKFSTPRVNISYGKSTSVELDDDFVAWAETNHHKEFLKYSVTADKTTIKEFLKNGGETEHARIKENVNLRIK